MASVASIINRCNRIAFGMRKYSVRAVSLVYSEYGEPIKVIQPTEQQLESPAPNQVLLKMLASPVNPADINTIQGELFHCLFIFYSSICNNYNNNNNSQHLNNTQVISHISYNVICVLCIYLTQYHNLRHTYKYYIFVLQI